ncbi:32569_t:CDS:1, partial [Gigaspora margarita]
PIITNSSELVHSGYLKFKEFIRAPENIPMINLTNNFFIIHVLIERLKPIVVQAYIDMKFNNVAIRYYEDYAEINRVFLSAARDVKPTPIFVVLSTDTPATPHTRCISQTQTLSGQTS